MAPCLRRGRPAALSCLIAVIGFAAPAGAEAATLPEIVVTPYYSPTLLSRTGSSLSVISGETIARSAPGSLAQVLRAIPGVSVIELGGPGATAEVRIRGAETGHTLVLIDGVRVNDFATARDDFDFSLIAPADIDRIEILRGPQSAVYGSDAMGGVINIITKRAAKKKFSVSASAEVGSYGSHAESASMGMTQGDFSLRFGGSRFFTEGFSRRGDRDGNEPDLYEKLAGNIRGSFDPKTGLGFDFGLNGSHVMSEYDAAGSNVAAPDANNTVDKKLLSGFFKFNWPNADAGFNQSLNVFASLSDRTNIERAPPTPSIPLSMFKSRSFGAEYRGLVDLDQFGSFLFGGRLEREMAENVAPAGGFSGYSRTKSTYAAFAEQKVSLGDRFHLAFSGRYDGEFDGDGHFTWRVTGVYEVPDSDTRLKGSVATGVKLPTAYMIANNIYQSATYAGVELNLRPENSIGFDAGIEQGLFDGRVRLSATGFANRFGNLTGTTSLSANPFDIAYANIANARTAGVELSAEADVIPGMLTVGGAYTYLYAVDGNDKPLARRPRNTGAITASLTPTDKIEASLSAVYVGDRYNSSGGTGVVLPAYWRVDLNASYALSKQTTLYGRVENLFNARYQDPNGFNTPGLSAYVGLRWKS